MNKVFLIISLIVCSCATGSKSLSFDDSEETLLLAVQNVLRNVPGNSRILITGISGTNEIRPEYIQSVILNEARGMTVITEGQRQSAIDSFRLDGIIGQMLGANIIFTGGVFGNEDTHRIVFRTLNVDTAQIVSSSCILFRQTNTEFINDVESFIQRINYSLSENIRTGSAISIYNNVGTFRNTDFVCDMLESNLANQLKYTMVARQEYNLDLIRKEQRFHRSGWVSEETVGYLGRFIGTDYLLFMDSIGTNIQATLVNVTNGNTITQENL